MRKLLILAVVACLGFGLTGCATDQQLDALAQCESGGNPTSVSPYGYYGAFQFALSTWQSMGETGSPIQYPYTYQRDVARRLQNQQGWKPWPGCAKKLGYL